jgi:putative endonuclease
MGKQISAAWFVYLLECANGKLYCGITTDVGKRFNAHISGKGAKFTRANRPSHIIAAKPCRNRWDASKLEYAVKRLAPTQKRALALEWSRQIPVSNCPKKNRYLSMVAQS